MTFFVGFLFLKLSTRGQRIREKEKKEKIDSDSTTVTVNVHESNWRLSLSKHSCSSVNLWTFGAVVPARALVFKIVRGDYFETSSVQVWNAGISVKVFRQISLFIHYLYLFSKLMIRLDYQSPVRENKPALVPPKEEGSKTGPGRRRKSSLVNDSHIYLFSHK